MKKEVKELLSSKEMNLPYLREAKLKLPLQGNFNELVNKIKEKGETVDSIFVDGFFAISKKDNMEKVTVVDFYRTFHFDLNKDESEIEGYTYFGFLDKVSYKAKLDKKYNYLIKATSKKNNITHVIIKIVFRNQDMVENLKKQALYERSSDSLTLSNVYDHVKTEKKVMSRAEAYFARPCVDCTNHGCQGDCEQWCGGSLCHRTCGTSCNKNCSTICYRDNWDGQGPYMDYS